MRGDGPDAARSQTLGDAGSEGDEPAAPEAGTVVAQFRIVRPLRAADSDGVYLAEDQAAGGLVALRLARAHDSADRGLKARFMSEARVLAALDRIHHSSILPVRRYGEHDGWLYIATQHADGTDLGQQIERAGALSVAQTLRVLNPVAEALDAAHARGVIHRNVTPASIIVAADGRPYISDFALSLHGTVRRGEGDREQPSTSRAGFVAPEQIDRRPIDARADVYALGCVLYACLTGEPPFAGDAEAVADGHLPGAHRPPSALRPDLPARVDEVIATALSKQANDRFASCTALMDAFAAAALPARPSSRRATPQPDPSPSWSVGLTGIGLALAAALTLVGMTLAAGFWNSSPSTPPNAPDASATPASTPVSTTPAPAETRSPEPSASTAESARPTAPPSTAAPLPSAGTGLPSLTAADARVVGSSGERTLDFTLSLSAPSTAAVDVQYETANGTALGGIDYTPAIGELTIPPGETSVVVRVPILPALPDETDESFTLRLLSATNVIIGVNTATGTITAPPPNRAPVCQPLSRHGKAGGSTTVNPACTDPDGDVLEYEIETRPTIGEARATGGRLVYEAFSGARGTDSFRYVASDGDLSSEPAIVTVAIAAGPQPNRSPRCEGREMSVAPGAADVIRPRCADRDGDRLRYSIASPPGQGTATITDEGRIRYVAGPGAAGTDTFTYTGTDGSLSSAPATVTVTIGSP
jgi:serine/threonine-protein kinase